MGSEPPFFFHASSRETHADETLEFKDEPGINFIKQQLAGFEKFIRKVSVK